MPLVWIALVGIANSWLEQLGEERARQLDAYAALITKMQARAEVRKSESKRMIKLAPADNLGITTKIFHSSASTKY